ncbi:MAG: glutathione S-transferase family protein [Pseudomonadota bacterium]
MIKLLSWTTPNGRKISIALEEMGLAYEAIAVDITAGEQNTPEFRKINPNGKIPAIIMPDGRTVMESGAILFFLGENANQFMPQRGTSAYWQMMEWLMWQASGQGPMLGQAHHFLHYNKGKSDYAEERYHAEAIRLYGVLNERLLGRQHILGTMSIVDFAIWPWISRFEWHEVDLNDFPNVREYYVRLADRPAFQRGYAEPIDVGPIPMPAAPKPLRLE